MAPLQSPEEQNKAWPLELIQHKQLEYLPVRSSTSTSQVQCQYCKDDWSAGPGMSWLTVSKAELLSRRTTAVIFSSSSNYKNITVQVNDCSLHTMVFPVGWLARILTVNVSVTISFIREPAIHLNQYTKIAVENWPLGLVIDKNTLCLWTLLLRRGLLTECFILSGKVPVYQWLVYQLSEKFYNHWDMFLDSAHEGFGSWEHVDAGELYNEPSQWLLTDISGAILWHPGPVGWQLSRTVIAWSS